MKTPQSQINYSAFTDHKRLLDIWSIVIAVGLLLFGGLLFLSYFVLNSPSIMQSSIRYKTAESTIGIGEVAGIAVTALAFLRYVSFKTKQHELIVRQFTADNGWSQVRQPKLDNVASVLLYTGMSWWATYAFQGHYGSHAFNCLMHQFDTDSYRSEPRRFICLSFALPKAYPMIVLDNLLNDHERGVKVSDLPERIPDSIPLRLEGDFNKYYRVSTTKGNEQEAMEALSPDIMAVLEDIAANRADIEMSAKKLFLVYEAEFYSEQNMTALFAAADAILNQLDQSSKTRPVTDIYEEKTIAETVRAARYKILFKQSFIEMIAYLIIMVIVFILMYSHFTEVINRTS